MTAPQENAVWYLRRHRLFDGATDEMIRGCSHLFVQRTYPKKTVLFEQGDEARMIYLVKNGKVQISRITADGKEIALAILGPGDIFGEEVVFTDNLVRTTRATVIDDDAYLCLSRMQDMFSILSRNPILTINVAKYLQEQRDDALAAIEDLASLKVSERIVHLLERLAEAHGVRDGDATRIDVRLTHAQIASLVGSTRETVSLELSTLVHARRVATNGTYFFMPLLSHA